MPAGTREAVPCYSVRLMRPWLTLLRGYPSIPQEALAELETYDVDGRMPASQMVELVEAAVLITGDPDLGLKAAQAASIGDYDVLEYAAASAATSREGLDTLMRYVSLVNDGLEVQAEVRDGFLRIRIRSALVLTRATADFQHAAFYVAARRWLGDALVLHEVSHSHPEPDDLSEYRKVYGNARLLFDEPCEGAVYDASVLDGAPPAADPKLHHLLRRHADALLASMPRLSSTAERVRAALAESLGVGRFSATAVAHAMHMSRRTMTRRLEEEGTSYKEVLDDVRRHLAVGYLTQTSMAVGEVAFLLGFSQGPAFHRAFKRWTGHTPIAFRERHLGG